MLFGGDTVLYYSGAKVKGEQTMNNWLKKREKELGYKGCRNCSKQIEPLRKCEWMEKGGDGKIHLICPRWERRADE